MLEVRLKRELAPFIIAPFVILLIFLFVISTGCVDLTSAYIPDSVLTKGWYENTAMRNTGTQFFGLEKWASTTYEINDDYPASLTVTTMKTMVLMDEQELQKQTRETLNTTLNENIEFVKCAKVEQKEDNSFTKLIKRIIWIILYLFLWT